MKLSFLLQKELIVTNIAGGNKTKKEILADLLAVLLKSSELKREGISGMEILDSLMLREREFSTGIGGGFAFPHARFDKMRGFYMLLGISRQGIEFQSMDHKPVNFVVLSLVSSGCPNLLLQTRAAIMRFLMAKENKNLLLSEDSPEKIWGLLDSSGINISEDMTARDIMFPKAGYVSPESTLRDAAVALHKYHADSLPVLDGVGHFLGDISCHDLFAYGLPDFFMELKTVSFVKHMYPFDKYFQIDETFKIKDLRIERDFPVIGPDATLMEIVFEMTAKNRLLLYVVENRKLLGIIDRHSIVDKILVVA